MHGIRSILLSLTLLLCFSCAKELKYEPNRGGLQEAGAASKQFTLKLTDKIDSESLGLDANSKIDGKSLFEVLTSQKAGRDDGQLCSACHNNERALGDYGVDQDPGSAIDDVDPDALISGRSWTGKDGWAERFIDNPTKPKHIQALLQFWVDGGYEI